MTRHEHRLLRHQTAIRRLQVLSAKRMTPRMQRMTVQGESFGIACHSGEKPLLQGKELARLPSRLARSVGEATR